MLQATIRLEYPDQATASAVAHAVVPDNTPTPAGLTVTVCQEGNSVTAEIRLDGKLATFVATIDDLLEAVSTAEKTIYMLKRK